MSQLPTAREVKRAEADLAHDVTVTVCIHRRRPWCRTCHDEALADIDEWAQGEPAPEDPEEDDEDEEVDEDEDEDEEDNIAPASRLPLRRR